ncbi:enoyl-CoA hydratase-related protein [Acuticoccus sp. MNP-M23]|uniref:enoyl-CoA hydratase-related protein n=1 Tax=Acuticoccus sp. MNP-M23 TaxID=3072793 RepID=UPI002815B0C7|nr:enoyl-CoA hydratase-related protein [Acuticoccus sp. MNP-M23]WMS42128.1 enoyl-CoA hydratase-related protein [Acuticoccus sp. MNP-M23]
MTATPYVLAEDHGAIRRIVLNRPQQRNLLTPEMIAALSDALDCTATVIVIASDGPAFCAGHDMKGMAAHHDDADGGRAYFEQLFRACGAMMGKIATLPQPVIAEVHAPAVAAGCQLVAACDLALCADTARFGTTGVTFGLYCATPAVPLTRTVAPKHAAEMLMTGSLIDAAEAVRIGLVNRAVPADTLTAQTMALAEKIAAHSGTVLALGKASVNETRPLELTEAYARAAGTMVDNLLLPDGREGLQAFAQKRPARWAEPDPRSDDRTAFWDARYSREEAAFGERPNAFLTSVRNRLPAGGRAFAAADGQGRNALWLASEGFAVTMNDLSAVATSQVRTRADVAGLEVEISPGDLRKVPPAEGAFDLVTAIYLHLPPALRREVHSALARALAPGGILVLEAFAPGQQALKAIHNSGGPGDPALYYTIDMLRADFSSLTPLLMEETETVLDEGSGHNGRAAVVRAIFERRL